MADVYGAYKPLRNYLQKVDLINGLGAIRYYVNYSQMKNSSPPPRDLEVEPLLFDENKGFTIFLPWQLAVLAREVVISSQTYGISKDFRKKKDFADGFNKLKAIDEYIAENFVDQSNVMHVVSKVMSHQQFAWQENRPNHQTWNRYYCIYQHPDVRPIFEKAFGLSVEKFFVFGMLTWYNYTQFLGLNYPPDFKLEKIGGTLEDYNLFLKHYALTLEEIREKLKSPEERHYDSDFLYYYDSLKRYPMILTEIDGQATHVCPVPTHLYWRTTDGVYYELINSTGFDQALGEAFKSYIGTVLGSQEFKHGVQIIDCDTYVKKGLPKADWLVINNDTALYVECKSKRLTVGAKIEHSFTPVTEAQLDKLAEGVVQCYKALEDAKNRNYKELSKVTKQYPMIVTLESWYIVGDMSRRLREAVMKEATKQKISEEIIKKSPYVVVSSQEFENLTAVLREHSLAEIIDPYFSDNQYEDWQFDTYLGHSFPKKSTDYKLFKKNYLTEKLEAILGKQLDE